MWGPTSRWCYKTLCRTHVALNCWKFEMLLHVNPTKSATHVLAAVFYFIFPCHMSAPKKTRNDFGKRFNAKLLVSERVSEPIKEKSRKQKTNIIKVATSMKTMALSAVKSTFPICWHTHSHMQVYICELMSTLPIEVDIRFWLPRQAPWPTL